MMPAATSHMYVRQVQLRQSQMQKLSMQQENLALKGAEENLEWRLRTVERLNHVRPHHCIV